MVDALFEAYHSFVSEKIDDYNSSFYYEAPQNILNAFLDGEIEKMDEDDYSGHSILKSRYQEQGA